MTRALAFWIVSVAALCAVSLTQAGCSSEDYYCDDTGCFYCDGIGCRAVDPPSRPTCRGDFECPSGTTCTTLGCTASCEGDESCSDGAVCRGGMCVGPTEPDPEPVPGSCERNTDCLASGLICVDGACVADETPACDADNPCDDGFVCADGECLAEDNSCQFNHECGEGRQCVNGRCRISCGETLDPCPGMLRCDDAKGFCRTTPPVTGECSRNVDCGTGRICLDSVCFDGCTDDEQCTGDEMYCAPDGLCRIDDRPRPFCTSNAQCRDGHPCIGGVCRTPCAGNRACLMIDVQFSQCLPHDDAPAGETGFCATTNEATSNCRTGDDCDAGRECLDGVCR